MAIIYSYPQKTTPAGNDFLVITDSEQPAPNKNRTKSLTVDNLANYVVTSTSGITGSGTLNTIAMFTPDGQSIGDSVITQASLGQAININTNLFVSDDFNLTGSAEVNSSLTVGGNVNINTLNDGYLPFANYSGSGTLEDSQLQQSTQLSNGLYQMRFNNADRFIINKPSSVTSGDPEYLIQQDGNFKVSFGWDDDGGGFGYIYNWAGNGLRLGAAGQNPQFELDTATPKIISYTDHEFQGDILGVNATLTDTLTVETIEAQGTGSVYLKGGVQIGDQQSDVLNIFSETALFGKIKDSTFSVGTAGQILVSDANSNVEWKSYSESGATFLGWARYDGAASFSNGTEITVTDGNFTDPVVSLVTNQIIDPYTNGASGKFVFTNDDLNAVYSLTVVFKASAANSNQTHIDVNFISGATDYERLSKSIGFYKGNDVVDNFHEVFQFYVDSDLITHGLQPRLYAQGGSVKFGDVIFFIQKQQQPAI